MQKDITHRIAYYTRKVAERVSIHRSKVLQPSMTYRDMRLIAYKKRMNELIKPN
ncbi:hypothetical protein NST02_18470 [Robertmurraya sp. FSL W8-0741]|jgi:hypothetical protein|uniref:hypothetical protein n=1 Tax=Robertmurraya sp. FSL W8-0741 TaxID=2954629 RepID=UPI0030FA7BFA